MNQLHKETDMNEPLRKEANRRVTKALDGLWKAVGPLDMEALGAMMDGAQDGFSNWMPPEHRPSVGKRVRVTMPLSLEYPDVGREGTVTAILPDGQLEVRERGGSWMSGPADHFIVVPR